jgi:hypothetical protein
MMPVAGLRDGDRAHGVVEGQAEDLDTDVNGVAGQISFRPTPTAVFEEDAGTGRRLKIARLICQELKHALLEQANLRIDGCGWEFLKAPSGDLG